MKFWIKRIAFILSVFTFFVVLVYGINPLDPFNTTVLMWAIGKATLAAFFFWIAGFVMGDVVFKGVVEDIGSDAIDKLDDGLLQHVRVVKSRPPLETVKSDPPLASKAKQA